MLKRIRGTVLLVCALWLAGCSQPRALSAPMAWNGLTPAKSTWAEIVDRWPKYETLVDVNNGQSRLISSEVISGTDFAPPFKKFQFLFHDDIVQVIDIQWSLELAEPQYRSLAEIVNRWGRPVIVTWSYDRYVRTAIWPEQGFYVYIRHGRAPQTVDPNAAEVHGMGLFVPVAADAFQFSSAGSLIPDENQFTRKTTDAPDGAPEDPFYWWMLTPVAPTR
jgi:hypothetical protein